MKDSELQLKIDESVGAPLLIVDFNVYVHKIIHFANEASMVYKNNLDSIIKLGSAYIFNQIPTLPYQNYRILIIADGPSSEHGNKYWRHLEIENDPRIQEAWDGFKPKHKIRTYKGGRNEKDEFFYRVYNIAKDYCEKYLNFYKFPLFEADDIASSLYRSNLRNQKDRVKVWMTIDNDWKQMVNDELNFIFYTIRTPRPNEWFLEQARNSSDVLLYSEKKLGMSISNPQELILAKVEFGDAGDNIPKNAPPEYMDLILPHPKYDIEKIFSEQYHIMVEDALKLEGNNHLEHLEETEKMFKKLNLKFMYRG